MNAPTIHVIGAVAIADMSEGFHHRTGSVRPLSRRASSPAPPNGSGGNSTCRTMSVMSVAVTTTFTLEGYRVTKYLGIVRGIIVRAPTISQGILGGLKSIVGGRIGAYTEMCEQARQQAYDLMLDHAKHMGANAVLGFHYDASDVGGQGHATEVLCYGTAVVVEPI